jgi:hypothetical protein
MWYDVDMKISVKMDADEIVKRLKERNPEFVKHIQDESISLEDFAKIVITQFKAFNCIP